MSMVTLAISCLTTSNLPWFMDPTFQLPMQYCSSQHWPFIWATREEFLLLSPVTSKIECCFSFGSIFSFFPELFLHWYPVAYWAPTNPGSSSFNVLSFRLFILFMGFFVARILKWLATPFSSEPHFVRTLYQDLPILGGPTWHGS